jgi:hypothetical protein
VQKDNDVTRREHREDRRDAVVRILGPFVLSLALIFSSLAFALGFAQRGPAPDHRTTLATMGARAFTAAGIPGDPFNVAFFGSEDELLRLMANAQWDPADPITLRSSLRITIDSVARRPYLDAPVSNLYVNGKKQDLAFEQPAARNPSKRHHVRFWRVDMSDPASRPLWIGAATFDERIGLSRVNHHVTHHISSDIDAERDKLLGDARHAGNVSISWIEDFQPIRDGYNGGGDPFHTDGRLGVITIDTSTSSH